MECCVVCRYDPDQEDLLEARKLQVDPRAAFLLATRTSWLVSTGTSKLLL
jgi:hypothetical protein